MQSFASKFQTPEFEEKSRICLKFKTIKPISSSNNSIEFVAPNFNSTEVKKERNAIRSF